MSNISAGQVSMPVLRLRLLLAVISKRRRTNLPMGMDDRQALNIMNLK